jgi:heterodisulfide reductase subunit B
MNHDLGVALAARNLALAEEQGIDELLAPCAACYGRLSFAQREMKRPEMRERIESITGRSGGGSVRVLNVLEALAARTHLIRQQSTDSLAGVKFACYYGCLLVRPHEVTGFDDSEQPTTMEEIVRATAAVPVHWTMVTECCGAGLTMARTESVLRLGRRILEAARAAHAAAVVVACPMCHSNLDFRQEAMTRRGESPMPVLYVTQVIGLALGLSDEMLGLQRHFVDARPFAEELRAASTGIKMGVRA